MKKFLPSAFRCAGGSTSIEYAIIAAVMAIAIVVGAANIGDNLSTVFTIIAENLLSQSKKLDL